MQFWEELSPPLRWMLALSLLIALGMLSFRQCNAAASPAPEVLKQRGIGNASGEPNR
jgi:hypothetical protein